MTINLRKILLADAWVCFVYGCILIGFANPLADLLVDPTRWRASFTASAALHGIGLFVLGMGIYAMWTSTSPSRTTTHVPVIISIEIVWCIACAVLLMLPGIALTAEGEIAVIASGVGVFVFFIGEIWGYRTSSCEGNLRHADAGAWSRAPDERGLTQRVAQRVDAANRPTQP